MTIAITFKVFFIAKYGEMVRIVGNCPELGDGNPHKARRMKFIGNRKWKINEQKTEIRFILTPLNAAFLEIKRKKSMEGQNFVPENSWKLYLQLLLVQQRYDLGIERSPTTLFLRNTFTFETWQSHFDSWQLVGKQTKKDSNPINAYHILWQTTLFYMLGDTQPRSLSPSQFISFHSSYLSQLSSLNSYHLYEAS